MAQIQMQAPNTGAPWNAQLPPPSGATYSVSASGIVSVNPEDVRLAQRSQAWVVMAGQPWPAAELLRMVSPGGAWPVSGSTTLPDGATLTISSSVALVPIAWVQHLRGMGWTPL